MPIQNEKFQPAPQPPGRVLPLPPPPPASSMVTLNPPALKDGRGSTYRPVASANGKEMAAHAELEVAPAAATQVPAGQGVGSTEDSGQKEPAGQGMRAPRGQ